MLGKLKTESGAKALCQASAPAGTTSTAPGELLCCNQTMETSQERSWAPHNHDHAVPCYRSRLKCFPVKIAACLESKALVKEICFHLFSEKTATTCAPARFLQADFGTETVSRFCGSGTQKTFIQKEEPGVCQHIVYKPPGQSAFNHSSSLPLMHHRLMCINQGIFVGFHKSFVCVH